MPTSGDEVDLEEWGRRWRFLRKEAPQLHDELVLMHGYCSIGPGCDTFDCLRRSDGERLWSFQRSPRALSRPAVSADGWVYVAEDCGRIHALDVRSGEVRWEKDTGRDEGVPYVSGTSYRHPSIAIVDRTLVHVDDRGRLRAYARDTGALEREQRITCSVVQIERHGDDLWISDRDGTITSIDPTTLAPRWQIRLPGRLKAPVIPVGEHFLALLDRGDLVARRRDDGRLHWWIDSIRTVARDPYGGRNVIAARRRGDLVVIDVGTGETAPLGRPTIRRVWGQVVVADHHLFVVTTGGVVRIDRGDGTALPVYHRTDRSRITSIDYADGILYVFERSAQGILTAVKDDRVRWRAAISDYFLT